jgi:hypothetical protein
MHEGDGNSAPQSKHRCGAQCREAYISLFPEFSKDLEFAHN